MLQQEEQKELIEKFVKANAYYKGNEDLLEDFCNEAYQKAYLILSTSENIQKTELFVTKIVNTTIISVLKQKQRYEKIRKEEHSAQQRSSSLTETQERNNENRNIEYDYIDPVNITDKIIIKESLLQNITDTVCIIHRELPHKLLYDIFYLRYVKKKTQSEISNELNLPQSEVCKRLINLSKLVSAYLYKN